MREARYGGPIPYLASVPVKQQPFKQLRFYLTESIPIFPLSQDTVTFFFPSPAVL